MVFDGVRLSEVGCACRTWVRLVAAACARRALKALWLQHNVSIDCAGNPKRSYSQFSTKRLGRFSYSQRSDGTCPRSYYVQRVGGIGPSSVLYDACRRQARGPSALSFLAIRANCGGRRLCAALIIGTVLVQRVDQAQQDPRPSCRTFYAAHSGDRICPTALWSLFHARAFRKHSEFREPPM